MYRITKILWEPLKTCCFFRFPCSFSPFWLRNMHSLADHLQKLKFLKMPLFFFYFIFLLQAEPLHAQSLTFNLKSAPADLTVSLNGEVLKPLSSAEGIRRYRINSSGILHFCADGYYGQAFSSEELPLVNGLLEVKLEKLNGFLKLRNEYPTGKQPKSAYFTPDGRRLFVPLLGEHGVDVFRYDQAAGLTYEKRLAVPGSNAAGFVEALIDERRRELWVSNMEEGKVHIFNLDTLAYKMSLSTGGIYPKVIVQNPAGNLTLVSNWASWDISVFNSNTKELLRRIPVGGTPRGMAYSPDGRFCYVAIYDEPLIAVVDMEQNKVSKRYRISGGVGAARHVIYRDGKLYVSDMYRGTVNILDAADGTVLASRRVGYNINTIVLSPDGKWVFASSRGMNHHEDYTKPGPDFGAVYMLSAGDLTLAESVWGRNQPTGLAVSPDGKYLVFTDFLDANLELYRIN